MRYWFDTEFIEDGETIDLLSIGIVADDGSTFYAENTDADLSRGSDWVALCQLFGTMMDLPKGWPMYCRDVKQLCDDLGNPSLPKQDSTEHHALADARWTRDAHAYLTDVYAPTMKRMAETH